MSNHFDFTPILENKVSNEKYESSESLHWKQFDNLLKRIQILEKQNFALKEMIVALLELKDTELAENFRRVYENIVKDELAQGNALRKLTTS